MAGPVNVIDWMRTGDTRAPENDPEGPGRRKPPAWLEDPVRAAGEGGGTGRTRGLQGAGPARLGRADLVSTSLLLTRGLYPEPMGRDGPPQGNDLTKLSVWAR